MITALLSQVKGMAVFDDGNQIGYLSVSDLEHPVYGAAPLLARAIQESSDLESLQVADLAALRTHLRIRQSREEMLHATLLLLDGTRPQHVRDLAAVSLSAPRQFDEWTWVEGVLLSSPLPASADPRGAANHETPHRKFFSDLTGLQTRVRALKTAWNALPSALFQAETREQLRVKAVRSGIFRSLILGTAKTAGNPLSIALWKYASALRRVDAMNLENVEVPLVEWLQNSSAAQTSDHVIWQITPWKSAWCADEWTRLEWNFAREAALDVTGTLSHKHIRSNLARNSLEKRMHKSWKYIRFNSEISSSVDLISELVSRDYDIDLGRLTPHTKPRNVSDTFQTRRLQGSGVVVLHYGAHAQSVESQLLSLVRACLDFDAVTPPRESSTAFDQQLVESSKSHYQAYSDRIVLSSTKLWPEASPHSEQDLVTHLLHRGHQQGGVNSASMDNFFLLVSQLRRALSVYALDRVFKRDGCIVYTIPAIRSNSAYLNKRYAVLLNFGNQRSHIFEGYLAWLLSCLQERLVADLVSGVPRDSCGWTLAADLGAGLGRGEQTVWHGVEKLRRRASGAGFASETFQLHEGGIRLNPELATPSMILSEPRIETIVG